MAVPPPMRLALAFNSATTSGVLAWRTVGDGFEVADLAAVVDGQAVDHLLLARIDPARFCFKVRTAADGDTRLDQWMAQLGAALVVNGSYFALDDRPDTPVLNNGVLMKPGDYEARAGAFTAEADFTGICDLTCETWREAFGSATDAMVSYPGCCSRGPRA